MTNHRYYIDSVDGITYDQGTGNLSITAEGQANLEYAARDYQRPFILSLEDQPIEITFPLVDNAIGYKIYTRADIDDWWTHRRELTRLRKLLNRRKKRARVRTGRRG